ncbi:hypothetical protein B0T14DRAFT_426372 [Immersiella caudata]|uniref:C2H2-type domain-containing protein n=1 Tax=Immersiella caudata TaxID=314043 RepID=A0AA40C491_9PEZI|nr:hypothetical protein B0T14DRAFT_426372 [Immersiella caudata]
MSVEQLKNADSGQVRAILIALCDDNEVRKKALDYYRQLNAVHVPNSTSKRARSPSPVIQICVQCESAFDKTDNKAKGCRYHSGEMEPDYDSDFWADHDERCHGTIDSDFCRSEYPEGFIWTCCEKGGDEEGCRMSRHVSDPNKNKRHGLEPVDPDSDCTYDSDGFGRDENEDEEGDEDDDEDEEEENDRARKRLRV